VPAQVIAKSAADHFRDSVHCTLAFPEQLMANSVKIIELYC